MNPRRITKSITIRRLVFRKLWVNQINNKGGALDKFHLLSRLAWCKIRQDFNESKRKAINFARSSAAHGSQMFSNGREKTQMSSRVAAMKEMNWAAARVYECMCVCCVYIKLKHKWPSSSLFLKRSLALRRLDLRGARANFSNIRFAKIIPGEQSGPFIYNWPTCGCCRAGKKCVSTSSSSSLLLVRSLVRSLTRRGQC